MDKEYAECEKCGHEMYTEQGSSYCLKCHPSRKPELIATRESNLAPQWLIFPKNIINTSRIIQISIENDILRVYAADSSIYVIPTKDLDATWKSLQIVFAEGVAKRG